jgi:hypothetical protein
MYWTNLLQVGAVLGHIVSALAMPTSENKVIQRQADSKYVFAHFMVSRNASVFAFCRMSWADTARYSVDIVADNDDFNTGRYRGKL